MEAKDFLERHKSADLLICDNALGLPKAAIYYWPPGNSDMGAALFKAVCIFCAQPIAGPDGACGKCADHAMTDLIADGVIIRGLRKLLEGLEDPFRGRLRRRLVKCPTCLTLIGIPTGKPEPEDKPQDPGCPGEGGK